MLRGKNARRRIWAWAIAAALVATVPVAAAQETELRAVRGTVGYQTAPDAPFTKVFGSFLLEDDQFALTRAASNGLLVLGDSSEVALGENTDVQVGQISRLAGGEPTAITLVDGAIRFAIRHPAGGQSNYRFTTTTSQIAVRGTVGVLSTGPNGDVLSCLDCATGDVTITAGGKTFALLTGQSAVVSVTGAVTISVTSAALAASFAHVGLSTTVNAASPFAGAIGSTTASAVGSVAAGVGAAGAAAAAAISTSANAANATRLPVISPAPAPSPSGAISIGVHARAPQPGPAALPAPPFGLGLPSVPGGRRP